MGKHSTVGTQLLAILKENEFSKEAFYTAMGISRATFYNLLDKKKEDYKKADIALICNLLNIFPEELGFSSDFLSSDFYLKKEKDLKLITYNFQLDGNPNYQPFLSQYFREFSECINSAKQSYFVLDYCAKNIGIALKANYSSQFFHEKNEKFFITLEEKLTRIKEAGDQFDYTRIIQLPLSEEHAYLKRDPIKEMIELLFDEAFVHVLKCFKQFPEYFTLYLIGVPIREFSYYIIDDKLIISLYNRVDRQGRSIPDMMYIQKVNPFSTEDVSFVLKESYKSDLRMISDIENEIFYNQFLEKTYELHRDINNEIEEIEKKIKKDEIQMRKMREKNADPQTFSDISHQITQLKRSLKLLTHRGNQINSKVALIKELNL